MSDLTGETIETLTYTVPQAAAALNVSARHVKYLIQKGTLKTVPGMGRRTLISKAWLGQWVETATSSERPEEQTDGLPGGQPGRGTSTAVSDAPRRDGSAARSENPSRTADSPELHLRASA